MSADTKRTIEVKRHGDEWQFYTDTAHEGLVWFGIFAGPLSGGVFLTVAQAEALATNLMLTVAATEAQKVAA